MANVQPINQRKSSTPLSDQQQVDTAFWSSKLTIAQWKKRMVDAQNHHTTVIHSLAWMPIEFVLQQMGHKWFIRGWPQWRNHMLQQEGELFRTPLASLDAVWGTITVGDSQYKPKTIFSTLSKGRLNLLRYFVKELGSSAYAAAKALNRDYSRVYKEILWLEQHNLIFKGKPEAGTHSVSRVPIYVRDSVYTQLYLAQQQ